jgi:hypothetical protein
MKTLLVHRSPVSLPAHAFAAHRLQRICLSSRRLTRVQLPPVLTARRAAQARQPAQVAACVATTERTHTARPSRLAPLASIAIMVAIVLLAAWSTGMLHR